MLIVKPRSIILIVDCTFFRGRGDKDGLMIFLDAITKQIVWYKFIQSETKENYLEGLNFLIKNNYTILSVTMDGKPGIPSVFRAYPVQLCQFHLQQSVIRKTTRKPKTELGKLIKSIADNYVKERWTEKQFIICYNRLKEDYQEFLEQMNDSKQYQHKSLRTAMNTIKSALPLLFIYEQYPNTSKNLFSEFPISIPNTTNHLDGGVNPKIKELVRNHRGMNLERRNKLIEIILHNLGK